MQRPVGVRRRLVAPEDIRQPVGRDDAPAVHRERGQQPAKLRRTQRHDRGEAARRTGGEQLERTQHPQSHSPSTRIRAERYLPDGFGLRP